MGGSVVFIGFCQAREANTSRVKPDRLAPCLDQRQRSAASGEKH